MFGKNRVRALARALPILVALSLSLSGLGGLVVAAEEPTAVGNGVYSGTLPGSTGAGTFALYHITYPGEGMLTVTLRPVYGDVTQAKAFGMVLYTSDGRQEPGIAQSNGMYLNVEYRASALEGLVLQVYNYNASEVSYDLEISGAAQVATEPEAAPQEEVTAPAVAAEEQVTEEPAATVAPEQVAEEPAATAAPAEAAETEEVVAETVVAEPVAESPVLLDVSETLVGDVGGAFVTYDVTAPTAAPLSIVMQPSKLDPSFGEAYGYIVWDAAGTRVAKGHADAAGSLKVTMTPVAGATYVIQVYNYAPGQPLTFGLQVTR
ncbi:MAG: hypothetical protein ABFD20_07875 [Anaerolineales bacterium]